jgi:translocation and assembly module TamA
VALGSRTIVTEVDIRWQGDGAEETELRNAARDFPIKPGDPLDHRSYDLAKQALLRQAARLGYPDVKATRAELRIDPRDDRAQIVMYLDTGDRYTIGEIRLRQEVLRPELVHRYLVDVQPGDVYSQQNLLEIQQDLIGAGYFAGVDVNPRFDQADDAQVPIVVDLTAASRQIVSFGLGYDTDIQFNTSVRWNHRRLNARGHQADARLKLSIVESALRGNYWIPVRDPRTDKVGFSGWLEAENSDNTTRKTMVAESAVYADWRTWTWKGFVENRWEQFTAGSEPQEEVNLISQGLSAQRRSFDEGLFPRIGWELFAGVRGSPGRVFGNKYVQGHVKTSVLAPLLPGGRLNLRGEAGGTAVDDFDPFPSSLRFYAGGDLSVRGYPWRSLGPRDEAGEVIGGRKVVTGSLGYDHRILEHWAAGGFVDAGNAFNDRLDKLIAGAGFGVRYLLPFGGVRIDLAWPLNQDESDPDLRRVRVHFGFEVNF